jgi:hypothetical protein
VRLTGVPDLFRLQINMSRLCSRKILRAAYVDFTAEIETIKIVELFLHYLEIILMVAFKLFPIGCIPDYFTTFSNGIVFYRSNMNTALH